MKNLILFLFLILIISGCQDVIEVDLPDAEPKLVIEATGRQFETNEVGEILVKLSETTPYFSEENAPVNNAEVKVFLDGNTYLPSEEEEGIYHIVLPMIENTDYELSVVVNEEEYMATTQLYPTVPFDYVEQETGGSFDPDLISIQAYFTDPAEEENYYYFEFLSKHGEVVDITSDDLINGNQVSTFYADEFEPGDEVKISIFGVSKRFTNYFSILLSQSNGSGNPFSTAPAVIRGNIQNLTQPENFPLGYFRISQSYQTVYTVQ